MQASNELSHISPRNVRPLALTSVEGYQDLARMGINIPERIVDRMLSGVGMDAIQNGLTTPSINTPIQFLQTWLPGFVKIMTAARKIDELIGISTVGNWEDVEVVQGILENVGTATPYGDYTNVPLSSYNLIFERRSVVRFEEGMRVGKLEEMRASRVRLNSPEAKRESAALALDIQRNAIGFFGFNAGINRTYGFLNDPGLPAYVTVPASGTGASTLWINKNFQQITADIRIAIAQLQNQSQDTIDPETVKITLALPTAVAAYLSVTTDFGMSVRGWLKDAYPNIRVVSAPQLNAANGGANVFYLYAETTPDASSDNGRTFDQIVPTKFMVLGVEQLSKAYQEDYSNATAGVMLKRPYAVVRYTGI